MYIERHAGKTVQTLSEMFGAVLVTGSRQVGKMTLLRNVIPSARWVSLDGPDTPKYSARGSVNVSEGL